MTETEKHDIRNDKEPAYFSGFDKDAWMNRTTHYEGKNLNAPYAEKKKLPD